MDTGADSSSDFIAYPTNRVVGTMPDAESADRAIEALLQVGFEREAIDLLQGERDLGRLDPTGASHGVVAQFQRAVLRTASGAKVAVLRRGPGMPHSDVAAGTGGREGTLAPGFTYWNEELNCSSCSFDLRLVRFERRSIRRVRKRRDVLSQ